jgi:putative ABC transport system permease protein
MNVIFGVQATSIMFVLVVVFAMCLSAGAWIALRQRVVFRLGVRNLPRRPAQTALIVVGLMLSTLIISAAFTTGDTLNYSIRSAAWDLCGHVDEIVLISAGEHEEGTTMSSIVGANMPEQVATDLSAELADNPDIDGVMPVLTESVPAVNQRTLLSEPSLILTGTDPAKIGPFGGITTPDGEAIDLAAIPAGAIVLGESAADELDAVVGDTLLVYARNQPYELTVAAIAADSPLTGKYDPGTVGGFAVPLVRAQEMLDQPGTISLVAVSNRGGVEGGVELTDPAVAAIDGALAGTPYRAEPLKRIFLDDAETAGNAFMSMFLIFGLFSIAVGILLIFLIFTMLAAERKPEMGMARAVGMRRRQLTQMFLAEGIAYDLASALVGAALGVGVAFVMAFVLARMFADFISIQPSASWSSLIIAYTLGVVVTFLAILASSWRVSKLSIVQAIRDIAEPGKPRAGRRWLYFGIAGLVIGLLLSWTGYDARQAFSFYTGVTLVPLSLAVLLRRFGVPARPLYSVAALLVLVFWLLPDSATSRFLPDMSGGIELFFVSGMALVSSATIIIMWNAESITWLVGTLGRAFSRWLPAVKTAVAYPLSNKGRTGMTIAMFSLVVFSLVMMAAINENIVAMLSGENAGGGWDVSAAQAPTNPIPDFRQALVDKRVDVSEVEATARLTTMPLYNTNVRMAGAPTWETYTINGMDDSFIAQSRIPLQTLATGYDSDEAVWAAIARDPDLAVIDAFALPTSGVQFEAPPFTLEGVEQDDKTMTPTAIEIADPASGRARTVTVIGIIDSEAITMSGIFVQQQTFDELFTLPEYITYLVRLAPGADAEATAKAIESSLITYGVQAQSIREIIDEMMSQSRGFLRLFEGFMGLGLVVGIAALGVIAFRSVVERRQQIGMLRAIGYQRAMVAASFMIESTMITILGVLSGTVLGLILARNLTTSDYFLSGSGHAFIVPWLDVVAFILIALAATLLMAYVPSRRASRVPIAQALRYE